MDSIFAEVVGPPQRRFHIYRDPPATSADQVRGWCFVVDEIDELGQSQPLWDTWEETLDEILRYPELYASEELAWRSTVDNGTVDIAAIKPLNETI